MIWFLTCFNCWNNIPWSNHREGLANVEMHLAFEKNDKAQTSLVPIDTLLLAINWKLLCNLSSLFKNAINWSAPPYLYEPEIQKKVLVCNRKHAFAIFLLRITNRYNHKWIKSLEPAPIDWAILTALGKVALVYIVRDTHVVVGQQVV